MISATKLGQIHRWVLSQNGQSLPHFGQKKEGESPSQNSIEFLFLILDNLFLILDILPLFPLTRRFSIFFLKYF